MSEKRSVTPAYPYRLTFPDFPESDCPEIPQAWKDASDDTPLCPSWLIGGLRIFVDYLDPTLREISVGKRFFVVDEDLWLGDELLQSDDWAEVLDFVAASPLSGTLGIHLQ
jgi:hypothetical protein